MAGSDDPLPTQETTTVVCSLPQQTSEPSETVSTILLTAALKLVIFFTATEQHTHIQMLSPV